MGARRHRVLTIIYPFHWSLARVEGGGQEDRRVAVNSHSALLGLLRRLIFPPERTRVVGFYLFLSFGMGGNVT